MEIESIVAYLLAVILVVFLLKVVFKVSINVIGFLVNSLIGAVIIWALNLFGLGVPITWLTSAIVGLLGVPGVLIVLAMKFLFKIIWNI